MATYNGAKYLQEQLESLATQTVLPSELVITDDHSTDATPEIIHRFAATAPFPVFLHINAKNLGWRENFFKAVKLCKSNLISLCDQDDVWYAEKLATLAPLFQDPAVLLAYHNADLIDATGKIYGIMRPEDLVPKRYLPLQYSLDWTNPYGLTMIFRKELLTLSELWKNPLHHWSQDDPFPHDKWLFNMATSLGTVIQIPDRLLGYRQHATNVVGWHTADSVKPFSSRRERTVNSINESLKIYRPFISVFKSASENSTQWSAPSVRAHEHARMQVCRLERRRVVYSSSRLTERASNWLALFSHGAYFRNTIGTLGRRALVMDVTIGLFG